SKDSVPKYWCELYPGRVPAGEFVHDPMPLMFATHSALRRASCTIEPGNQPVGTRPRSLDFPGRNETTATAFCVPLQTNKVPPVLSKASALGLAPKKSPVCHFREIVSTTLSVRASMTLTVSLPALATARWR